MNLDFQDIFNELLNILPSGWENAIFMAEYTSGSYSMRCYSKESNNNYINVMKMKGVMQARLFVVTLQTNCYAICYAITLKFDKNGKFSSDFDYNSHEENVLEYLEQWEQKNVL